MSLSWVYTHPRYVENTSNTSRDQTGLNPGETSKSLTWMSRWKLGSMPRINGLCYNLLINGVYWDNPLILTFDPNFQADIQVIEKEHHLNQTSISGFHVNCPGCAPLENNHATSCNMKKGRLGKGNNFYKPPILGFLMLVFGAADYMH